MPTRLSQHINTLYSKSISCKDDTHCDLRHHHFAGVYMNGRCISIGYNRKSCSLCGSSKRKSSVERGLHYKQSRQGRTNNTCRGGCHRSIPRRPKTPIAHVLPNRHPSQPKAKLCRNVKTVRKL